MSGGSLDYFYASLQEHDRDFGDRELDNLTKDLAELFRAREWYLSGDTGEGSWTEARDWFKEKWFTDYGRRERVEEYLSQIVDEIRDTFGLNMWNKCKFCRYWSGKDYTYGRCEFKKNELTHRSESCERFERSPINAEN